MGMPRVRFTVRTMMVAVVVVALTLVFAVPACQRVFWLYQHALIGGASILYRHAQHDDAARLNPSNPTYRVGQPIPLEANYAFTPGSWTPAGLPYRVTVEVKITDPTTFRTVYETYRRTHYALTDAGSSEGARGEVHCSLTPRQAGLHAVRYELHVTDLFGRTQRDVAVATGWFTAK
jgi:hypothetical protein